MTAHARNVSGGVGPPRGAADPPGQDGSGSTRSRWQGLGGIGRGEFLAVALGTAVVVAAVVVPYLHDPAVAPVVNPDRWGYRDFADAAPLFGARHVHVGWGTPAAVAIAAAVIGWGPQIAVRVRWRTLLVGTWLTGLAWAVALALIDGFHQGFSSKFTGPDEYLHDVPRFADLPDALRHFAARIPDYLPDSWATQVSGHPPGAVLAFVGLDRIGLGGPVWAAVLCTAVGASAAPAILTTLAALGEEAMARRAAPFLALTPAAIWIAVSADALFTGVVAWGIALLAFSAGASVRRQAVAAIGAGILLGFGVYLSYGLILMALPAAAVLLAARTGRPLYGALAGALAVAAVFTALGFRWFDGYHQVGVRYYQGVAADRPYLYWVWANYASLICVVGLATCAALPVILRRRAWRTFSPIPILVTAFLLAVTLADLSGLSKAETERIWLPFAVWIVSATALLPSTSHRFWLIVHAVGALAISHLILTNS